MAEKKTANEVANKLHVERETFKGKDDKEYWAYFVRGKIRGRDVKVGLIPPDKGGYEVLEIVFDEGKTADLVLVPYEMKDEDTGKIISGFTYEAQNVDTDGTVYKCNVKPARRSDKSLLNMLLSQLPKETKKPVEPEKQEKNIAENK